MYNGVLKDGNDAEGKSKVCYGIRKTGQNSRLSSYNLYACFKGFTKENH